MQEAWQSSRDACIYSTRRHTNRTVQRPTTGRSCIKSNYILWFMDFMPKLFYNPLLPSHESTALVRLNLLVGEVSWSHSDTTHSVGLQWMCDSRDIFLTTHNTPNRLISMQPAGFKPAIIASEQPQTHALIYLPNWKYSPGIYYCFTHRKFSTSR
jgi:hypothetical protein